MAQVQLFNKQNNWLIERKNNFLESLDIINSNTKLQSIFWVEIINFLKNWVNNQNSYTPREDVNWLKNNLNFVIENNLYDKFQSEINQKKMNNYNLLQKSFEYISIINDFVISYKENLKKERKKQEEISKIEKLKQKEKIEKENELQNLEKMLDQL